MSKTDVKWTFMNSNQPLHGRYAPGATWNHPGRGELWSEDRERAAQLRQLADWLRAEFGPEAVQFTMNEVSEPATGAAGTLYQPEEAHQPWPGTRHQAHLQCEGPVFVEALVKLQSVSGVVVSSPLQLMMRLVRLAADIVSCEDVVAFAAPRDIKLEEVLLACTEFARQEEEGMGRWTSMGTFAAAWLPGWNLPEHRALRALYLSEAAAVSAARLGDASAARSAESQHWVDAFLFLCIDKFVRFNVVEPTKQEPDVRSNGTSSYRIMYRGEAEVLSAWERALVSANPLDLAVPPRITVQSVLQGLQVRPVHYVDVIKPNRIRKINRKPCALCAPVTRLIVGDHLEALELWLTAKGPRGGFPQPRRLDILAKAIADIAASRAQSMPHMERSAPTQG